MRATLTGRRASVRHECEHAFVSYVELHAHSAYSFLDGASQPEELALAALEQGYTAFALTDHDGVSGSMEFAQAASAHGLQAIHGAEVSLTGGHHLTLLVESTAGWGNLCRLLTHAHAHTRDGRVGAPVGDPRVPLEAVLEHAEGLVCLSGCAGRGIEDLASLERLRGAFGPDHLRIELQRPFLAGDRERMRRRIGLARRLGVPTVATGNVHAHTRARARLQDALVAIRLATTLDASEPDRRGNHTCALARPAAMAARFSDVPEAVAETERLAERLRFDPAAHPGYPYPRARGPHPPREPPRACPPPFADPHPPGRP